MQQTLTFMCFLWGLWAPSLQIPAMKVVKYVDMLDSFIDSEACDMDEDSVAHEI